MEDFVSLVQWHIADKKPEMVFITEKRSDARKKPCFAKLNISSAHSDGLSLDVEIELRADIVPDECNLIRKIMDDELDSFFRFFNSKVEIAAIKRSVHKSSGGWTEAPGLSFSPGFLWFSKDGDGYGFVSIMDQELDEEKNGGWTDEGNFGRIVNWAELESLIKSPFATSLRYKFEGYSERFPMNSAADEGMPG